MPLDLENLPDFEMPDISSMTLAEAADALEVASFRAGYLICKDGHHSTSMFSPLPSSMITVPSLVPLPVQPIARHRQR